MVDRSILGLGVYELEFEMKATQAFVPDEDALAVPGVVPGPTIPSVPSAGQTPLIRGASASSVSTSTAGPVLEPLSLEGPASKRARLERDIAVPRVGGLLDEMDVEEDIASVLNAQWSPTLASDIPFRAPESAT